MKWQTEIKVKLEICSALKKAVNSMDPQHNSPQCNAGLTVAGMGIGL